MESKKRTFEKLIENRNENKILNKYGILCFKLNRNTNRNENINKFIENMNNYLEKLEEIKIEYGKYPDIIGCNDLLLPSLEIKTEGELSSIFKIDELVTDLIEYPRFSYSLRKENERLDNLYKKILINNKTIKTIGIYKELNKLGYNYVCWGKGEYNPWGDNNVNGILIHKDIEKDVDIEKFRVIQLETHRGDGYLCYNKEIPIESEYIFKHLQDITTKKVKMLHEETGILCILPLKNKNVNIYLSKIVEKNQLSTIRKKILDQPYNKNNILMI